MRLGLRLSLAGRAVVALATLGPVAALVCLLVTVVCGAVVFSFAGPAVEAVRTLAASPRLAAVTPLPAPAVVVLAVVALVAVFGGWESLAPYTRDDYLIPPSGPVQWLLVAVVLGACYEVVVETAATAVGLVDAFATVVVALVGGLGFGLLGTVWLLRAEVRNLRSLSVRGTEPADADAHGRLVGAVDRLSGVAGVPAPEVRVLDSPRPLARTAGTRRSAALVVSTGLLAALSDAELDAVVAHEVAHLANGDSRLMSLALTPVVLADDLFVDDDPDLDDLFWNLVGGLFRLVGGFGASVFAVGREAAADETAARLTGDPAALASALRTLSGRDPPTTDLREWSASVAALGVLPSLAPDRDREWPFRTHPPTEERIERLRALVAAYEER